MLDTARQRLAGRMLAWGSRLHARAGALERPAGRATILVFFHGHSLAHTIRPLVACRALRHRGFRVVCAGRGAHAFRLRREGFAVRDAETLPQERMDEYVARGEYAYYDLPWIDRCVQSERALIRAVEADLVVHDMKPTAWLSARLEGVDDVRITQAYNQPGYPHLVPMGEGFDPSPGPFAEYLASRADEVRPQRSFFLLADVPGLHPPPRGPAPAGYHYVGPLLDQPLEPERLALLDDGWDTRLPLVYVTCGSSGRYPEYLDELVEQAARQDFRLLVTTAGRWRGPAAGERVRVVEFLPGEWVLRRASALVGVVGVGAIYQALGCGVPIVGAPEHLDQEQHLARVQDLGLGVRIDRRRFQAPVILDAVRAVLDPGAGYRQRCRQFAGQVGRWRGGSRVAELIGRHFAERGSDYRCEDSTAVGEEPFLDHLTGSTAPVLDREALRDLLRRGIGRGLPHRMGPAGVQYDRLDSWNWMYDREPRFFEADYRAGEERRRLGFARQGRVRCRNRRARYRVRYDLSLRAEGVSRRVKLFLPYPIDRPGQQRVLRLVSLEPAELGSCLLPALGFAYGPELSLEPGRESLEFSYACELEVRESGPVRQRVALSTRARARYLELPPSLLQQPEVVRFRRRLGLRRDAGDEERARAIYGELVRGTRFRKTRDRTQGLTYSTVSVLRDRVGHCITLSRAFIALCRAEGLPAREVVGALAGYPDGSGRFAMATDGESIFGHTWAEVLVDDRVWMPVEFHGIVVGEGAVTRSNVIDASLRASAAADTRPYRDYYFGSIDNLRVLCSPSVLRMPEVLVERPEHRPGDRRRWQWDPDLRFGCRLEVTCL